MSKYVQPKRTTKNLSVNNYWSIKQSLTYQPNLIQQQDSQQNNHHLQQNYNPAFNPKHLNVQTLRKRHRYQKPVQQAKIFKPLLMLLHHSIQPEDTYVQQYLYQLNYMLPLAILDVKKMLFTLALIIKKLNQIYTILSDNLHCDQTWKLIQNILRDTKSESYSLFLSILLPKMLQLSKNNCFQQKYFRNFFDTWCVFLQTNFQKITKSANSLKDFFQIANKMLFKSPNKYIKKFSLQSMSYLLGNLDDNLYRNFIAELISKLSQNNKIDDVQLIGEIMRCRSSIMKGCISNLGIEIIINNLKMLKDFEQQADTQMDIESNTDLSQIYVSYLVQILSRLDIKGQDNGELMFDFTDVLKMLIQICSKKQSEYTSGYKYLNERIMMKVIVLILRTKFSKNRQFKTWTVIEKQIVQQFLLKNCKQLFQKFQLDNQQKDMTMEYIGQFFHKQQVNQNEAIINILRQNKTSNQTNILNILNDQHLLLFLTNLNQQKINKKTVQMIMLISKQTLQNYIKKKYDQKQEKAHRNMLIINKLINLIKISQFESTLNLQSLNIQQELLIKKAEQLITNNNKQSLMNNNNNQIATFLRFLSVLSISEKHSNLKKIVFSLFKNSISSFKIKLDSQILSKADSENREIYNHYKHIKSLYINNHISTSNSWFIEAINLIETTLLVISKMTKNEDELKKDYLQFFANIKTWEPFFINRVSLIKSLSSFSNYQISFELLQSKHRKVRQILLSQIIKNLKCNEKILSLFNMIFEIEGQDIDLDNERQVKMRLVQMETLMIKFKSQIFQSQNHELIAQLITHWCLGFVYTGFKLISDPLISFIILFVTTFLEIHPNSSIKMQIMNYLYYWNYRHSRALQENIQILDNDKQCQQKQRNIKDDQLRQAINKQFEVSDLQTTQWIGLNRIALVFRNSSKLKKIFEKELQYLLQTYFTQQYKRSENNLQPYLKQIKQNKECSNKIKLNLKNFISPKTSLLQIMLKIAPLQFKPPLSAIHLTQQYFNVPVISKIKTQKWQYLWHKKKIFKRNEQGNKDVDIQHLSPQQQDLYLHYLWKQILKANTTKRRIILEHIRDRLPNRISFCQYENLMQIFSDSCFKILQRQSSQQMDLIIKVFNLKSLKLRMYIMRSMLKLLINYLDQNSIKKIMMFLETILRFSNQQEQQFENHQQIQQIQEEQQQDVIEQMQNEVQSYQQQQDKKSNKKNLKGKKQIRKQIYKIYQNLFNYHYPKIDKNQIYSLFKQLKQQNKYQYLSKAAENSVPGLLIMLQSISKVDIKILSQDQEIINSLITIFSPKAKQQSLKIVSYIFYRILGIQKSINQQDEEVKETNPNLRTLNQDQMEIQNSEYHNTNEIVIKNINNFINILKQYIDKSSKLQLQVLKIASKLFQIYPSTDNINLICNFNISNWQQILAQRISHLIIGIKKKLKEKQSQELNLLLQLSINYSKKISTKVLAQKLVCLLPYVHNFDRRTLINEIIENSQRNQNGLKVNEQIFQISKLFNSTIKKGLQVTMNFENFFTGLKRYEEIAKNKNKILNQFEHEFLIYNLLAHCSSQQLSVRKGVTSGLKYFLSTQYLDYSQIIPQQQQFQAFKSNKHFQSLKKILLILLQLLKKSVSKDDNLFWATLTNIGCCVRSIKQFKTKYHLSTQLNYLICEITDQQQKQTDFFYMISSISLGNKHKGLKMIKQLLNQQIKRRVENKIIEQEKKYNYLPNPIFTIVIPCLQHIIFPSIQSQNDKNSHTHGNLSSTLTLISLQIYHLAMNSTIAGFSQQKKQLKKIVSKIKFTETLAKRNVLLVRVIGEIIEAIDLPNTTKAIKQVIQKQGVNNFNQKIVQNAFKKNYNKFQQSDDQMIQDQVRKSLKPQGQLDLYDPIANDDQMLNKNFMKLQKRLRVQEQLQQNQIQNDTQDKPQTNMIRFLKHSILTPLKTMLFFESRSNREKQQQKDKGRMLLSVAVTKILIKFPLSIFLLQFQRILTKMTRLLKKKDVNVRDSARKCLAEISKIVGPQLLYSMLRQMKLSLRDNFQGHVFNYSTWYILQNMGQLSQNGSLDYCLPLILPAVIDQIFGKSSIEKQMVDQGNVPTLLMQAKKKKGHDLLVILTKQLSPLKIQYLVNYFSKNLKEFLNTETNVSRFDQVIVSVTSGLGKNQMFLKQENSQLYLKILSKAITQLQPDIKIYCFENQKKNIHQSTIADKSTKKPKRAGNKQAFILQQQAGRNQSIFKKIIKQVVQKRNYEIIINCIIRFYLSLVSLLLRKRILNSQSQIFKQTENQLNFNILINFIFQIMDHRDNGIVSRSLRIIHEILGWELQSVVKIRKRVCRKVLMLMDKLTSADNQLLKQCFGVLNDIFSKIDITPQIAQQLVILLQVHITNQSIQMGLSQPYKLFRLMLYKQVRSIDLSSMYQYVRVQMINTHDKDIRNLAKNICSTYLKKYIIEKQRKQQLMFYLNNLQTKYDEAKKCILQILEDFIKESQKKQMEKYSQVIMMGIATTYANGNNEEYQQHFEKICLLALSKIDPSKIQNFLTGKCLIWINKKNPQLIRVCGYYLSKIITVSKLIKLNKQHLQKINSQIIDLFGDQLSKLRQYEQQLFDERKQKQVLKQDKKWQQIIMKDMGSIQSFKCSSCIPLATQIIFKLKENHNISTILNNNQFIKISWNLLAAPHYKLYSNALRILQEQDQLIQKIGKQTIANKQRSKDNLYHIFNKIIQNNHPCNQLMQKIIQQASINNKLDVLQCVFRILLKSISKFIMNVNKNQDFLKATLQTLNYLLTYKQQSKTYLFKESQNQKENTKDLIWQVAKIARNNLVSEQMKQINQKNAQSIRGIIGASQYYKLLSEIQTTRKQMRTQQKVQMAQLAVTNQKLYQEMKTGKKKRKFNS